MAECFNWDADIIEQKSKHRKRIVDDDDDEQSSPRMHVRVNFRCETEKTWMQYCNVGQLLFTKTESHRKRRMKRSRTWFNYALPDEDLKKLLLEKLVIFDLRSDNQNSKGKLVEKVINHARNLISEGKERSFSLVVNIQKRVLYTENRVFREMISGGDVNTVPASMKAISSLSKKEMAYDDENCGGVHEMKSCTVCLEEFSKGSKVLAMPCSHVFHSNCIVEWLNRSRYCPICRFKMPKAKESYVYVYLRYVSI